MTMILLESVGPDLVPYLVVAIKLFNKMLSGAQLRV